MKDIQEEIVKVVYATSNEWSAFRNKYWWPNLSKWQHIRFVLQEDL